MHVSVLRESTIYQLIIYCGLHSCCLLWYSFRVSSLEWLCVQLSITWIKHCNSRLACTSSVDQNVWIYLSNTLFTWLNAEGKRQLGLRALKRLYCGTLAFGVSLAISCFWQNTQPTHTCTHTHCACIVYTGTCCTYTFAYAHTNTHTVTHTHIYTYAHTNMHKHTHTTIHTCTYII